jgi:hypothetical protein
MLENEHIIDIDASRRPYNAYLVLPLGLLQQLTPLIRDEIMKGLIDTDNNDRVVLHLLLDPDKINLLRKLTASWSQGSFIRK